MKALTRFALLAVLAGFPTAATHAGDAWTIRWWTGLPVAAHALCGSASRYTAAEGGRIFASVDGVEWQMLLESPDYTVSDLVDRDGVLYASTDEGIILTLPASSAEWTATDLGAGPISLLCEGGSRILAITAAGVCVTTDGATWSQPGGPDLTSSKSVVFNGSKFFAAQPGTQLIATSVDGVTWESVTTPAEDGTLLGDIAYGNGLLLAQTTEGGILSPDGVSWTAATLPNAEQCISGTQQGFVTFLLLHLGGLRIPGAVYQSTDGMNWDYTTNPNLSSRLPAYAVDGPAGRLAAPGRSENDMVADLVDVETPVIPAFSPLFTPEISRAGGRLFCWLDVLRTSTDGDAWQTVDIDGSPVTVSDKHGIAASTAGWLLLNDGLLFLSTDLSLWSALTPVFPGTWSDLTIDSIGGLGDTFYASVTFQDGTLGGLHAVAKSADGIHWSDVGLTGLGVSRIVQGESSLLVQDRTLKLVPDSGEWDPGTISAYYTSDGATWQPLFGSMLVGEVGDEWLGANGPGAQANFWNPTKGLRTMQMGTAAGFPDGTSGGLLLGDGKGYYIYLPTPDIGAAPGYYVGNRIWTGRSVSRLAPVQMPVAPWDARLANNQIVICTRKAIFTLTYAQDHLWGARTRQYEGGWIASPWYGWLSDTDYPWIYHAGHGWQYTTGDADSLWLWDVALGRWVWTSDYYYPWMWLSGPDARWVWFVAGSTTPDRAFWDDISHNWVQEPDLVAPGQ